MGLNVKDHYRQAFPEEAVWMEPFFEEVCPVDELTFGEHPQGDDIKMSGNIRIDVAHTIWTLEMSRKILKANPNPSPAADKLIASLDEATALVKEIFPVKSTE